MAGEWMVAIVAELCDAGKTAVEGERCGVNCSQLDTVCGRLSLSPLSLETEDGNLTNATVFSISQAEAYGYGFLMIFIISLLSLLGVVLVPFIRHNSRLVVVYRYLLTLLISMGVAALVSDALLHLIPNALGLHSHDHSEEEIHEELDQREVVWKMCAVLGGALSFFVLELTLRTCTSRLGHTHSHGVLESSLSLDSQSLLPQGSQPEAVAGGYREEACPNGLPRTSGDTPPSPSKPDYGAVGRDDCETTHHTPSCLTPVTSIKPLAWVIILGDGMHNLTDGLAVGVAISQSLGLGLSTAIAILFHEIPHELSDYAILLHTGMSWYKALFLNFASSLTSLVGFFVGVAIGTDSEESNEWLLAVIAGQFLYIALVDLLPEVLHSKEMGLHKVVQVAMVFLGLAVGFSILLTIALFEDSINVSIN